MAQVENDIDVGNTANAEQSTVINHTDTSEPQDTVGVVPAEKPTDTPTGEPETTTSVHIPAEPSTSTADPSNAPIDPTISVEVVTATSVDVPVVEDPVVDLWERVTTDAGDFTSWTTLVETVLQGVSTIDLFCSKHCVFLFVFYHFMFLEDGTLGQPRVPIKSRI